MVCNIIQIGIIYKIAKKSLLKKLLILSPAALVLGYFAPWAIMPILMVGGAHLCFEGYEKLHSMFTKHQHAGAVPKLLIVIQPEELEMERVNGAVRTDIILSTEIMAIAYSQISSQALVNQIVVMVAVAILITVAVYGFVGLLVKFDDIGVHLAKDKYHSTTRKIGRGIVKFMPHLLKIISYVGIAAMLWVGAEIIAHGIPFTTNLVHYLENSLSKMPMIAWLAQALACGVAGLFLGFVLEKIVRLVKKIIANKLVKKGSEGGPPSIGGHMDEMR